MQLRPSVTMRIHHPVPHETILWLILRLHALDHNEAELVRITDFVRRIRCLQRSRNIHLNPLTLAKNQSTTAWTLRQLGLATTVNELLTVLVKSVYVALSRRVAWSLTAELLEATLADVVLYLNRYHRDLLWARCHSSLSLSRYSC